jgi:predicted  nucleic acid-binding Zn-ribbon protein
LVAPETQVSSLFVPCRCSKKRQYENLQEQLQASARQNAALKGRLAQVEAERDEFRQLAVDREKKLQASLVHLSAAQVSHT